MMLMREHVRAGALAAIGFAVAVYSLDGYRFCAGVAFGYGVVQLSQAVRAWLWWRDIVRTYHAVERRSREC